MYAGRQHVLSNDGYHIGLRGQGQRPLGTWGEVNGERRLICFPSWLLIGFIREEKNASRRWYKIMKAIFWYHAHQKKCMCVCRAYFVRSWPRLQLCSRMTCCHALACNSLVERIRNKMHGYTEYGGNRRWIVFNGLCGDCLDVANVVILFRQLIRYRPSISLSTVAVMERKCPMEAKEWAAPFLSFSCVIWSRRVCGMDLSFF